jgi:hypothetical protein
MKNLMIVAILSLCLGLSGCSHLTGLLDAVAVAAAAAPAAIAALEASGVVSTADGNKVMALTETVAQDTGKAITDSESGLSTAKISAAIIADYSNLPATIPGLSPQAQAVAQGVLAAVQAVLVAVGTGKTNEKTFKMTHDVKMKLETTRGKCEKAAGDAKAARK